MQRMLDFRCLNVFRECFICSNRCSADGGLGGNYLGLQNEPAILDPSGMLTLMLYLGPTL